MTDPETERAAMDAALEHLPPASAAQGNPGHDDALERSRGAMLLRDRALGFTYDELAQRHGYSEGSNARQALLRALDRHEALNAAQLRMVENERYELDQRRLRAIIGSDTTTDRVRIQAIDARTRSAARHARMNGLDAPVQVALSAGVEADLADALAELADVLEDVVPGEVVQVQDEAPPTD